MAMYANVNGASKLLAQTSAEAGGGVTELYCNTTESFSNSSPYIGYRRMITFPSNYKEVEIEAYGQNIYTISNQCIRFEFGLSQSNSSTIFHRRNTIINRSATSFDNYISQDVTDSSSGRMSAINESLTDLMPSTEYFIIRGKIFPQNATNDAMIFAGTITSMNYLIHLY